MAPPPLPFFSASPTAQSGGKATWTLPPGTTWRIWSISFKLDLSGSTHTCNPFVRFVDSNSVIIAGGIIGAAQASGTTVTYSASPWLDPCGTGATALGTFTPDTFAGITLVDGCQVIVEADDSTSGTIDTTAKLVSPSLWVESLGGGLASDMIPLLTPVAITDQVAA